MLIKIGDLFIEKIDSTKNSGNVTIVTLNELNKYNFLEKEVKILPVIKYLSNEEIIPMVENMINTADNELFLTTPWFYLDKIKDLLIQRRRDGIIIKVLLRKYKLRDNIKHKKTIEQLDKAGIQVGINNITHKKMLIKDENEVLVTSKNFIESSAIDSGVWFNNPNEVKKAREDFLRLWNERYFDS